MTDTPITDAQVEAAWEPFHAQISIAGPSVSVSPVWPGFEYMVKIYPGILSPTVYVFRRPIAMARAVREVMGGDD